MRRFQKIDINEPSLDDAILILRGLKPYYESHHKVRYTSDALKTAVELSARYINDRKLPDKAIDVIDKVGAAQMLLPPSKRVAGIAHLVVLTELENHDDAILFIDEIHTVIGAGATSGGAMDASNLLKPALASGKVRCIALSGSLRSLI